MESQKRIEIDGYTYILTHAPTRVGIHASAKIMQLAGGAIAGLEGGFLAAVGSFLKSPNLGADIEGLCDQLSPYTQIEGAKGATTALDKVFDVHFAGRGGSLIRWLRAVIEWDLHSFLDGIGALVDEAGEAVKKLGESKSPSPKDAATSG